MQHGARGTEPAGAQGVGRADAPTQTVAKTLATLNDEAFSRSEECLLARDYD